MLMILSPGQATTVRGFSVNGKLLVENLHMESLMAQRHIDDHLQSYDLQAHDSDIIHEFVDSASSARKRYFQGQKERLLAKERTSKDCQVAELNEEILKLNTGNAAQVNNFRPSKKFRQGIVGCSEKTNFC